MLRFRSCHFTDIEITVYYAAHLGTLCLKINNNIRTKTKNNNKYIYTKIMIYHMLKNEFEAVKYNQ